MVFDVEVAGDEGRGLAPDPRGEGLGGLHPVVFYHLDLHSRGGRRRRRRRRRRKRGEEVKSNVCMGGSFCTVRVSHPCRRRRTHT